MLRDPARDAPAGPAVPAVRLGIRTQLVGLMLAAIFAIVAIVASYFPARQIFELREGVRDRAAVYARLGSQQLRSAVAFGDQETARELLAALGKDPLLDGVALYTEGGARLGAVGHLSELAERARFGFAEPRTFYLPGRVLAAAPVKSLEGPKGTLLLELSTQKALQARDRLVKAALAVGLGALLLGSVVAWLIARSLAQRVAKLASAATRVAGGDLEQLLETGTARDEIAVLSHGFNAMVLRLRALIQHIQDSAREQSARLEKLVRRRTAELDRKNRDLHLVLDNVEQGFVTIDRDARIVGARSRIIGDWFGAPDGQPSLWAYLEGSCPGTRSTFEVAWEQVLDSLLPLEVTLDQLPHSVHAGERYFRIEYKPLGAHEQLDKLLVVISDVTLARQRERQEQAERDLLGASARLLNDRAGFLECHAETERLIARVTENVSDLAALKHDLHTLKGNSAVFGLAGLTSISHELESALESLDPERLDRTPLLDHWQSLRAKLALLLGDAPKGALQLDGGEYRALLAEIDRGLAHERLARRVRAWRLESMRARLARVAAQLSAIAERLGKGPVQSRIECPNLYLGSGELREFWSAFSHVLRNTALYGVEPREQRQRRGAAEEVALRAGVQGDRLFVEIEDFGPGIDWEAVRARATARQLPHQTEADLQAALFTDGISTRTGVDESAGRGVGLGAVRETCARQNGEIEVSSTQGSGTRFRFSWPVRQFTSLTLLDAPEAS